MTNCLFTCCTDNYLIYAEYLYKSMSKTNKNIIFEIFLINCNNPKDNFNEVSDKCKEQIYEIHKLDFINFGYYK